jgi:hypothetical protein
MKSFSLKQGCLFLALFWCFWAHGLTCFQKLQNASDLKPSALVSIYLQTDLTGQQRLAVLEALKEKQLILLNSPDHSPLVAQVTTHSPREISLLKGIEQVTQAWTDTLRVWKKGRTWTRPRESLMDNDLPENWRQRQTPLRGMGAATLTQIRQIARDYGVVVVMNRSRPATEELIQKESFLFGGNILYADDLPEDPGLIEIPGLALHLLPNARSLAVRGTLNPLQSRSRVLADLDKVEEMRVFGRYVPDAVAPWITADKVLASSSELLEKRQTALDRVNDFLSNRSPNLSEIRLLNNSLRSFFKLFMDQRPEAFRNFFIKHRNDFATTEAGQQWTNLNFHPSSNARFFYYALKNAKTQASLRGKPLQSEQLGEYFVYQNRMVILRNLLLGGDEVFFQQTLPVRRSRRGNNVEFRVGIFQGRVVASHFRFNMECYPEEAEGAARFVKGIFARLPVKYRTLSAGLDVAQLKDGSFRIIEANFGTNSSFSLPDTIPVYANTALSNFLGRPTPLIRHLNAVFDRGMKAQANALRIARAEQPRDEEEVALRPDDVFEYFRDRYLENWRKTHQTRQTKLKENPYWYLWALLVEAGEHKDEELLSLAQMANDYWLETVSEPWPAFQ